MKDNRPQMTKVWDITVEINTKFDGQYEYGTCHKVYYHDFGHHNKVKETELFPTKEELLTSL